MRMSFKKNLKILIVDNDKTIHEDFREVLSGKNKTSRKLDELEVVLFDKSNEAKLLFPAYELDFAFHGEEALQKVTSTGKSGEPYAVCFADVHKSKGWDGIETVKRIREVDNDIQIVICSVYSEYSWDEIFLELGNSDNLSFLRKPFDRLEVRQIASTLSAKWNFYRTSRLKIEQLQNAVQKKTADLKKALIDLENRKNAEIEAINKLETAYEALEKNHQQLQSLVTIDSLTGLSNRRNFDDKLDEYAHLSERLVQPLSCIISDIDHFKLVNDDFGHHVGDEVLRHIAQTLASNTRKTDVIARYGGEEFVLLLPNTEQEKACQLAEKLRLAIQESAVVIAGLSHHVTVSMGVCGRQTKASEMWALVENADQALYKAKRKGRNRVCCHETD